MNKVWSKLFGINKKESLVDILKGYTIEEIKKAVPLAHEGFHASKNPPKTKLLKVKMGRNTVGRYII